MLQARVLVRCVCRGRTSDAGDPIREDFELGLDLLLDGLAAQVLAHPQQDGTDPPATEVSPVVLAERELQTVTAQRKAAQARVKELERREREAQRAKDRARRADG